MNKILLTGSLLLAHSLLHAQPPRAPRPAERWSHDSSFLATELKLADNKLRKLQPAFADFYKNMDALVADERPRPPRFVDVQKLVKQRDAVVLRELSKEEGEDFLRIEHRLMPPPPGEPRHERPGGPGAPGDRQGPPSGPEGGAPPQRPERGQQ